MHSYDGERSQFIDDDDDDDKLVTIFYIKSIKLLALDSPVNLSTERSIAAV